MMGELIDWLKGLFTRGVEYVKIAATNKYLKLREKAAEIVLKYNVPRTQRTDSDSNEARAGMNEDSARSSEADRTTRHRTRPSQPSMSDEGMRVARSHYLEDATSEDVGRRANRYDQVREDVRMRPGLIDADSEWEADLKMKIARGEDIQQEIEQNPQLDWGTVKNQLGMEWIAKLGYNQHRGQLADKLNEGTEQADETSGIETGEDVDTDGAGVSPSTTGASSGAGRVGSNSYTGYHSSTDLSGTASVNVDTDAGSVSTVSSSGSSTSTGVTGSGTGVSSGGTGGGTGASTGVSAGTGASTGAGGSGGGNS